MDTPRRRAAIRSAAARDPRIYQILTLSSLLAYGVAALDFGVRPLDCAMVLGTCLTVQTVACRLSARRRLDPLAGSDGGRSAGDGEIPHDLPPLTGPV